MISGGCSLPGSPPRVWGQPGAPRRHERGRRFTPTRVGTTAWGRVTKAIQGGSPPRVWGQQSPECATGSTAPVHPHACGDNSTVDGLHGFCDGSPPRVWGQLRLEARRRHATRFTPTRVGTTRTPPPVLAFISVHPHACGDNDVDVLGFIVHNRFTPTRVGTTNSTAPPPTMMTGSPPRVWGQRPRRPPLKMP